MSTHQPHTETHWNKTQVCDRGWTDAGITKFLGDPDLLARNKRRRSGPKIRLYLQTRVLAAENTAAWKSWRELSETRRAAQRERADKSRAETLGVAAQALDSLELKPALRGLAYEQLKQKATDRFLERERLREERSGGRYTAEQVTSRRTDAFFHRVIVNWLRHEGTQYDSSLDEYFNLVGVNIAKDMIRERAYELIAAEYPVLADECDRQLAVRRATAMRKTGQDVSVRA